MKRPLLRTIASSAALCFSLAGTAQLAHSQDAAPAEDAAQEEQPQPVYDPPEEDALETPSADAGNRLLIVPISVQLDDMSLAAEQIVEFLADAATKHGAIVETSEASRAEVTDLSDCQDEAPACMQEMLGAVSADTMVLGSMTATEGSWVLTLKKVHRGQADTITTHVLNQSDTEVLRGQLTDLANQTFSADDFTKPDDKLVVPDPTPNPGPTPGPSPASGFALSKVSTTAWVVTGAGVGAAVLGAVFLRLASSKQDWVDDAPDLTLEDIKNLQTVEDKADRYELLGNSFLIAGALTTVGGITWAILQAKGGASPESSSMVLAPSPTRGGAMVTLSWRQ